MSGDRDALESQSIFVLREAFNRIETSAQSGGQCRAQASANGSAPVSERVKPVQALHAGSCFSSAFQVSTQASLRVNLPSITDA